MNKKTIDTDTKEMMQHLTCVVGVGDWGVAYGVAWHVVCWGKIISVSEQKFLTIKIEPGGQEQTWSRSFVEIFPTQEDARKKFYGEIGKCSEGG